MQQLTTAQKYLCYKKNKACGLMRHKYTGSFFPTTDQDKWPEDSTLLLEE